MLGSLQLLAHFALLPALTFTCSLISTCSHAHFASLCASLIIIILFCVFFFFLLCEYTVEIYMLITALGAFEISARRLDKKCAMSSGGRRRVTRLRCRNVCENLFRFDKVCQTKIFTRFLCRRRWHGEQEAGKRQTRMVAEGRREGWFNLQANVYFLWFSSNIIFIFIVIVKNLLGYYELWKHFNWKYLIFSFIWENDL